MNLYQRIVLVLGAVAILVVWLTCPFTSSAYWRGIEDYKSQPDLVRKLERQDYWSSPRKIQPFAIRASVAVLTTAALTLALRGVKKPTH